MIAKGKFVVMVLLAFSMLSNGYSEEGFYYRDSDGTLYYYSKKYLSDIRKAVEAEEKYRAEMEKKEKEKKKKKPPTEKDKINELHNFLFTNKRLLFKGFYVKIMCMPKESKKKRKVALITNKKGGVAVILEILKNGKEVTCYK